MDSILTRPERPADHEAVRAVNLSAFPSPVEADLVDALRRDACWLPGLSWVAQAPDGQVAGHALLTRLRVEGAGTAGDALALAPVAVSPSWQRQGYGTALVRAVLAAADATGERLVVVLGDPRYYRRFGFAPASLHGVSGPYEVPDAVFQALPLGGYDGGPRGEAVYAAPFRSL
ncbi:GNAT family N-acetyltransferase [Streptomyces sp. ICBB 8177]|nr:GNAT family N-acetyltransferase [Streptomyces sp. ICBB 8177]